MPYRFLEGLTMADIAFEASGKTLEELFVSAANAMTNTQIQDLKQIKKKEEKEFGLEAVSEERLLHDFLQELIFLKDSELLLFREYELKMVRAAKGYGLIVKAKGEKLDPKRHTLLVDVKAVSWHMFKLQKTSDGWRATVIIDV